MVPGLTLSLLSEDFHKHASGTPASCVIVDFSQAYVWLSTVSRIKERTD